MTEKSLPQAYKPTLKQSLVTNYRRAPQPYREMRERRGTEREIQSVLSASHSLHISRQAHIGPKKRGWRKKMKKKMV